MGMTREEAIKILENFPIDTRRTGCLEAREALKVAISALRPITRQQVEKMRGAWIIEDAGKGDRRKKCSLCDTPISGWWGRDRFCANCGAPMTDEAVDILVKRLEGLYGKEEIG